MGATEKRADSPIRHQQVARAGVRYRVELVPSAARALKKLDHRTRLRVARMIDGLADDARPQGVKLLSVEDRIYRLRAGDFRILYQINDKVLLILVVAIGHRREVYRRMQ